MGKYVKDVPDLGEMFAEANEDVEWFDPNGHGYILVTLDADAVTADYFKVSTVLEETYSTEKVASFVTRRDGEAMTALAKA